MYISVEQALEVYDELINAKEGKGSSGENVSEIYACRLLPKDSVAIVKVTPSGNITYDNSANEQKAAEDLHTLCMLFEDKYHVKIKIDDANINDWIRSVRRGISFFNTRVKIKVEKQ